MIDEIDQDELLATLPKLLRDLAHEFDIDTATKLADWRGGQSIFVPKKINSNHRIARRIGLAAARWLSSQYPGENIMIDKASATLRYLRDREICQHSDAGLSLNKLAEKYDTTQRHILRILKKGTVDPTPDLFA